MMAFLFSLEPSNSCKQHQAVSRSLSADRGWWKWEEGKWRLSWGWREGWGQRACQKSVAKLHIFRIINSWIKINSSVWYSKRTLQHVEKWGLKCEICKTYHRFILCLVYEQCLPQWPLFIFMCSCQLTILFKKSEDVWEKETTEMSSVQGLELCTEPLHRRNGQNIITSGDHKYLYQMSIHAQKIEIQSEECIICGAWKV